MSQQTAHPSQPHAVWVVAADHARARLFFAPAPTAPLQELEDLVSDRPGHIVKGRDGPTRAVGQHGSHKERAADQFAGAVCQRLSQARVADSMGRLYVIAEPKFLGLMRKHMDPATQALVVDEIDKDVTRHSAAELRALLPRQL